MMFLLLLLINCGGQVLTTQSKSSASSSSRYHESAGDFLDDDYDGDDEYDDEYYDDEGYDDEYDDDDEYEDEEYRAPVSSFTDFQNAILRGNYRYFKAMLNTTYIKASFVDQYGEGNNTILHAILRSQDKNKVQYLEAVKEMAPLQYTTFLNARNSEALFPAELSLNLKEWDAFKYLSRDIALEKGISEQYLMTIVAMLAAENRQDIMEAIEKVYEKAYPGVKGYYDNTPIKNSYIFYRLMDSENGLVFLDGKDFIYYAVKYGNLELVEFLITKFVNLNHNYGGQFVIGFRKFLSDVAKENISNKEVRSKITDIIKKYSGKKEYK